MIPYNHVIKYGKEEVEGYLNGHVLVEPKVDGSNSSIYYDGNDFVVQSRKRVITPEKDNANFANYMLNSDDKVPTAIRKFCIEHPNVCIYGEYIGRTKMTQKFIGTIKYYLHGGFFVFDLRDLRDATQEDFIEGHRGYYTPDDDIYLELKSLLDDEDGFNHMIPVIAEFDGPTLDDILKVMEDCHWNIPEDQHEEGVVMKNYAYTDAYNHHQFAKIVRKEYVESKQRKNKQYRPAPDSTDVEREIVAECLLDSKMEKTKNKVEILMGDWKNDGKHISCFLGLIWNDLINEDLDSKLIKRYRNPKIDFGVLKAETYAAGRKFLNL